VKYILIECVHKPVS